MCLATALLMERRSAESLPSSILLHVQCRDQAADGVFVTREGVSLTQPEPSCISLSRRACTPSRAAHELACASGERGKKEGGGK